MYIIQVMCRDGYKKLKLTNVNTRIITELTEQTHLIRFGLVGLILIEFYPINRLPWREAPSRSWSCPTSVWHDRIEKSPPFPPASRHCSRRLQCRPRAGLGAS